MKIEVFLVAFLLFASVVDCMADVYRYTDSKGEIHFVDEVSKVPKRYRSQLQDMGEQGNLNVVESSRSGNGGPVKATEKSSRNRAQVSPDVEVFMTSWCGYCKKMIAFLREKGIPFTAHDIEDDKDAARTYRELGGSGVPVVRVGSHVVHGYNPDAVMGYYNEGR
jgi:glutaredoxin